MIELPRPIVDKLLRAHRANNYLGVEAMGLPIPPVTSRYPLFRLDRELPDVYDILDHVGLSADVYCNDLYDRQYINVYSPCEDDPYNSECDEIAELRVEPRSVMYIGPVRELVVETKTPTFERPGLKLIHDHIEYEDVRGEVELSSVLNFYDRRLPDGNLYLFTSIDDAVTLLSLFDNPEAGDLLREWTPELAPVWDGLEQLAKETRVEYSEEDMKFFEAAGLGVEGTPFEFGPVVTPKGRISIPDAIIKALNKKLEEEGIDPRADIYFGKRFGCVAGLGCVIFEERPETVLKCIFEHQRLKEAYNKWRKEFLKRWDYTAELFLFLSGSYCVCGLGETETFKEKWPDSLAEAIEFAVRHYRPGEREGKCVCFDASCRETEPDLRRLEELLDVYLGRLHRAIWRGLAVVERGVKAWEESGMLKATTKEELGNLADEIYGNLW